MRRFAVWAIGCVAGFALAWAIAALHGLEHMRRSIVLYVLNFVLLGVNFGFLSLLIAQRWGKTAPRRPSDKTFR